MPKKRVLNPQSVWDEAQVRIAFDNENIKRSHVERLYKWLCRDPHVPYSDIPDLPKAAISLLESKFTRFTSKVTCCQSSQDGTRKLLLEMQDGLQIESVIMVYDTSAKAGSSVPVLDLDASDSTAGRQRSTLCISSQVGCQMGCTFCATGTMGLIADLTAGEIVEQAIHARQYSPFKNIVFMGMGEPLNNYNEVRTAVAWLTDGRYLGLQRHKVTISTVGVIPRINQLSVDLPGVSLAFSLHAPNQTLRQSIVPSAKAYPLHKLMNSMDNFLDASHKNAKIFIEYVMLSDVNDNEEQARELGELVKHRPSEYMINLIPWNPIYSPDIEFKAPDPARITKFHDILREYGACGQLVVESQDKAKSKSASSSVAITSKANGGGTVDIEDVAIGAAATGGGGSGISLSKLWSFLKK